MTRVGQVMLQMLSIVGQQFAEMHARGVYTDEQYQMISDMMQGLKQMIFLKEDPS